VTTAQPAPTTGGARWSITYREDGRVAYFVQGFEWAEAGSHETYVEAQRAVDKCIAKRQMREGK
jgi:hypothetical protein